MEGIDCVYREKGQPGLRPGYGKALETRMTRLENKMEEVCLSLQDVLSLLQTTGTSLQTVDLEISEVGSSKASNGARVWQASQQLSEVAPIASHQEIEQLSPFISLTELQTTDSRLPAQEIIEELVELFFELIYPWVPLFYRPSFISNLFSPGRQILLHGIVVITFRFWRKDAPSAEMRENYIKISREQILLGMIDACSLISTQALALLAVDAIGQGPGPRTWNIMAMLISASKQMGLAKGLYSASTDTNTALVGNDDPDDNMDLSSIDIEERRRLFWTI